MKILVMSWRNLWRNKRRTLITVSSIFFGVILSSLMSSMQEGSYTNMIKNVVNFYAGFIQVQNEDYWEDKSINHSFILDSALQVQLGQFEEITGIIPRLESFALASSGANTKGAMVMGIDPEREAGMTSVDAKIIEGKYLKNGDDGVLIGYELAAKLKLSAGDTVVLFGQGYHGVTAAGKFPVRGLFKQSNPNLNRQLVYMEIQSAQSFYAAEDILTSLILEVKNNDIMKKVLPKIREKINSPYRVMSWEEMFPTILQQIESDRSSAFVMKLILYIVIMFGIFGTVMMMISERKKEFGVMMALGMQRFKLAITVFIETLWIGLLGVVAGFLGSMPVVAYFFYNPIPLSGQGAEWMADLGFEPYMFFAWEPSVFMYQMLAIMIMTCFISIFPFVRIVRLSEIKALKG
ncbi:MULTISPECIES: ABC transporter permease [unclassified Saccharicrinis]|uniref:ABC transporter permease n=1 Tax=unclassified Saccharicrinis TaxID=2646859 RepID=UPI003D344281